ncbi:MAG: hypothetical protein WAV79_06285 [Anaerolineae bacterium]
MEAIRLRPDLLVSLEDDARQEGRSLSDIVNDAVAYYLREQQRAKLDREISAYESMHSDLWRKFPKEWVAIHERRVADHDPDRGLLYRRIRETYGLLPILIRQVEEFPAREIWLRTPSTGAIS